MPLFYKKDINPTTSLAIWKIEEAEAFFLDYVPLKSTITHPHKRLQHLAGRYLLQYLYPDFPISSIQIADTRKPYLEDEKYHFSISHSGDYAAAIVSSTERTGIDIELVRPTVAKIAHKFLHPEEINQLLGVDIHTKLGDIVQIQSILLPKLTELTVHWCAKEAIFKWWGLGDVDFSEMMRIDDFILSDEGTLRSRFIKDNLPHPITPQYKIFDGLCLVWLSENWQ